MENVLKSMGFGLHIFKDTDHSVLYYLPNKKDKPIKDKTDLMFYVLANKVDAVNESQKTELKKWGIAYTFCKVCHLNHFTKCINNE